MDVTNLFTHEDMLKDFDVTPAPNTALTPDKKINLVRGRLSNLIKQFLGIQKDAVLHKSGHMTNFITLLANKGMICVPSDLDNPSPELTIYEQTIDSYGISHAIIDAAWSRRSFTKYKFKITTIAETAGGPIDPGGTTCADGDAGCNFISVIDDTEAVSINYNMSSIRMNVIIEYKVVNRYILDEGLPQFEYSIKQETPTTPMFIKPTKFIINRKGKIQGEPDIYKYIAGNPTKNKAIYDIYAKYGPTQDPNPQDTQEIILYLVLKSLGDGTLAILPKELKKQQPRVIGIHNYKPNGTHTFDAIGSKQYFLFTRDQGVFRRVIANEGNAVMLAQPSQEILKLLASSSASSASASASFDASKLAAESKRIFIYNPEKIEEVIIKDLKNSCTMAVQKNIDCIKKIREFIIQYANKSGEPQLVLTTQYSDIVVTSNVLNLLIICAHIIILANLIIIYEYYIQFQKATDLIRDDTIVSDTNKSTLEQIKRQFHMFASAFTGRDLIFDFKKGTKFLLQDMFVVKTIPILSEDSIYCNELRKTLQIFVTDSLKCVYDYSTITPLNLRINNNRPPCIVLTGKYTIIEQFNRKSSSPPDINTHGIIFDINRHLLRHCYSHIKGTFSQVIIKLQGKPIKVLNIDPQLTEIADGINKDKKFELIGIGEDDKLISSGGMLNTSIQEKRRLEREYESEYERQRQARPRLETKPDGKKFYTLNSLRSAMPPPLSAMPPPLSFGSLSSSSGTLSDSNHDSKITDIVMETQDAAYMSPPLNLGSHSYSNDTPGFSVYEAETAALVTETPVDVKMSLPDDRLRLLSSYINENWWFIFFCTSIPITFKDVFLEITGLELVDHNENCLKYIEQIIDDELDIGAGFQEKFSDMEYLHKVIYFIFFYLMEPGDTAEYGDVTMFAGGAIIGGKLKIKQKRTSTKRIRSIKKRSSIKKIKNSIKKRSTIKKRKPIKIKNLTKKRKSIKRKSSTKKV